MKHSLAYRIFRKDIGRKVMALLMALLVFAAFEQQTQVTLTVSVRIEYVDAPSGTDDGWVLFVIQRSDPTQPLVVPATSSRPRTLELQLSGTKETVNQLKNSAQRFEFDPTKEGEHPLELADLQRIDAVRDRLREVRILRPITLRIVVEETRDVFLGREHLQLSGTPTAGTRVPGPQDEDALVFRPRTITLVGSNERLNQVLDPSNPQPLFEVDVSNRSGVYESPLVLLASLDDELKVQDRNPRVQVTFPLDMEPVGDPIRKEVHLIREPLGLEQNQDLRAHLNQGKRLTFETEEDRTRLVQIYRPRGARRDTSALLETLAREDVLLIAPWHHVSDLLKIRVELMTVGAFPEGWEVRFAEGESDRISVHWVEGAQEPSTGNGSDDEQ